MSGPSGAGKTTLAKRVRKYRPSMHFPVSCTTRPMRNGECNGVDYHFWTEELFERQVRSGQFAESAMIHGYRYGTLKIDLDLALTPGREQDIFLEIDIQGMRRIKSRFPEVVTIFVLPPSFDALEARLRDRDRGETEEEMVIRLATAREESACAGEFDYHIENRDLSVALRAVIGIMDGKRAAAS